MGCDVAMLAESLTAALAMAEALDMPLVAIHIDQAIAQLSPSSDLLDKLLNGDAGTAKVRADF